MELINNRYKVLKVLVEDFYVTKYLVSDVLRRHKLLCINMFGGSSASKDMLSFLNSEFVKLKNTNCKGIVNIYRYGAVANIDNRAAKEEKYYYITEYFEGIQDGLNAFKDMNEDDKLSMFAEVCCTINTLKLKGISYGEVLIDNVHLIKNVTGYSVKLGDIVSTYLSRHNYDNFKPESIEDNGKVKVEDNKVIYSLLLLLIRIFESTDNKEAVSTKSLAILLEEFQLEKITSVTGLIERINNIFNKKFKYFYIEELERLSFNGRMVGRRDVVNNLKEKINGLYKGETKGSLIGIHGEAGIGKTRLLRHMVHGLNIYRVRAYQYAPDEGDNKLSLLREILSTVEGEIYEKYEKELLNLMPTLFSDKDTSLTSMSMESKQRYRIINRVIALLNEISKNELLVIAIDDLDNCDDFYLDLIEYIFEDNNAKIMVLFNYNSNSLNFEGKFKEFFNRIRGKEFFSNIRLDELNEEETIEMVGDILSMPISPKDIGGRIYSFTYGNPQFIEEVIKELFSKQHIYINKEAGVWCTNYNKIEEIPIPIDLEHAMINQIGDIKGNITNILMNLSVFKGEVHRKMLGSLSYKEESVIEEVLSGLIKNGVIIEKVTDRGIYYNYSNKLLKKMMYEKLSKDERKKKHSRVVALIEESLQDARAEYNDDITYHLEGAEDWEGLFKQCVVNAEILEKNELYESAAGFAEKAIAALSEDSTDERLSELLLKLGGYYRGNGNIQRAKECFERCFKISDINNQINFKFKALIKMAYIYFNKQNIEECRKRISMAEDLLLKYPYLTEEKLELNLLRIRLCELNEEYHRGLQICWDSLELCNGQYPRVEGRILTVIGTIYLDLGSLEKSLEYFEKSIKYFEEIGFPKGAMRSLNEVGRISGEYLQDLEKALENYLKLKSIAKTNNSFDANLVAVINIAEIYFYQFKYEEALSYFKDASEKCAKVDFEAGIFHNYTFITFIYLILQDYNNVQKYFELLNNELIQYPEQGSNIRYYYKVQAALLLRFGEIEKALVLAESKVEEYSNDSSMNKWHTVYIFSTIKLYSASSKEEIEELVKDIELIMSNVIDLNIKAEILYGFCFDLLKNKYIDQCRQLVNKYDISTTVPMIDAKKNYIMSVIGKAEDRFIRLIQSLELAEKGKDQEMLWVIYCSLGDFYFRKEKYFYAVNYYFEATEKIKALTNSVPENYRKSYFKFHNMIEPFQKLAEVREMYEEVETAIDKDDFLVDSNEDLDELFKYKNLKELLSNSEFIKSAQSIFDSTHNNEIKDIKDILQNLSSDSINNLDMIMKYIARITLAKEAYILHEELDGNITVLSGNSEAYFKVDKRFILDEVRVTKKPMIITDKMLDVNRYKLETMNLENKVIMCIPIIACSNRDYNEINTEKSDGLKYETQTLGYAYLESERLLNNINEEALRTCLEIMPLTAFVMEKYLLRISSSIDKLTKTLTRKSLEDVLVEQTYRSQNSKSEFSIIMVDLDNFKHINDKFGHQTGDYVLKSVCSLVMSSIRKIDSCGRYGGEEFVIVLPDTPLQGAAVVAEKIRKEIETAKFLSNSQAVTVSMGVAAYPLQGSSVKELIEKADQALYVAKNLGRNRCQVWNEKFKGNVNVTNQLAGIVTGNVVQDHRRVSVMIEIINIVKGLDKAENKIYKLLGRIIEITETQRGYFFIVEQEQVKESYIRKMFDEGWCKGTYNKNMINDVIKSKKGKFLIDWDEVYDYDTRRGMPDWKSVIAVPIVSNGNVKAVLSLYLSAKVKEFTNDDLNYISALAQLAEGIL